jgi:hypothetical protein
MIFMTGLYPFGSSASTEVKRLAKWAIAAWGLSRWCSTPLTTARVSFSLSTSYMFPTSNETELESCGGIRARAALMAAPAGSIPRMKEGPKRSAISIVKSAIAATDIDNLDGPGKVVCEHLNEYLGLPASSVARGLSIDSRIDVSTMCSDVGVERINVFLKRTNPVFHRVSKTQKQIEDWQQWASGIPLVPPQPQPLGEPTRSHFLPI